MLNNHKTVLCISFLTVSSFSFADVQKTIFDVSDIPVKIREDSGEIAKYQQRRFRQYENNTLMLDYFNGNQLDKHIDAKLSVAYLLTAPKKSDYKDSKKGDWNIAFSASVEFDFYMGTRHSGPVVGRRYNPGIQLYRSYDNYEGWREYRASLEHESNGQSTENLETLTSITNEFLNAYSDDNTVDIDKALEFASETISMGNNFVSVGGVYRVNNDKLKNQQCNTELSCFDIHIKLRDNSFITDENSGNFRSIQAAAQNLSDYQGISLSYFNRADIYGKHDVAIELSYITGQINGGSPGKRNTFKANLYYNWKLNNDHVTVPLVVSCQKGYMHDLYNFAQKNTECTFGFHFLY